MLGLKRKASRRDSDSEDGASSSGSVPTGRLANLDIFNSLVGPSSASNHRNMEPEGDAGSDDDAEFIRASIEKRNVKGGMDVAKKVAKSQGVSAKAVSGGGSFQSMGLNPALLRALLIHGYRTPTPIQRQAIPSLIATPSRDLVGMARTGSGKTLAYMVPLLQRLGGRHSATFGARALILVPTRELALQVMKVGKELSRGLNGSGGDHAGDAPDESSTIGSKSQGLRWSLIVGGESLDQQFNMIAGNPDVIVATPGRLLHLVVEMNLELRLVQFVVFDEADRLFELGFATALHEIVQRLPASRQTLLFSATLPENLVEFARAGLQDPKLVRLDAESKISSDLRMAFFSVKEAEKEASLLYLLRDVIKVPQAIDRPKGDGGNDKGKGKRRPKRNDGPVNLAAHQTLVFAATKHHVEFLHNLLTAAGYAVSHIYGSLDQAARRLQMEAFKEGRSDILVVTDVAARGIDIPVLENVINYDFPHGARVFVHRVGRTARAGRQGWAWSFVSYSDLPHLLDLQLFLGRDFVTTIKSDDEEATFSKNLVIGTFDRDEVAEEVDHIRSLEVTSSNLPSLREVMLRGHQLYERTKGKASQASYQRAKEMAKNEKWGLAGTAGDGLAIHPAVSWKRKRHAGLAANEEEATNEDEVKKRYDMLKAVSNFRPQETVFELGTRGKNVGSLLMKDRRKAMEKAALRSRKSTAVEVDEAEDDLVMEDAKSTFPEAGPSTGTAFRDSDFYVSYEKKDANTEKGYSMKEGGNFNENVRNVTLELNADENLGRKIKKTKWDRSKKKYVGDGDGADNVKMIRTENGTKLPATYRSGRFDEWKKKTRVKLPRTGEEELQGRDPVSKAGDRTYRHNKVTEAKPLDPKQFGYDRKIRQIRKKSQNEAADEEGGGAPKGKGGPSWKKPIRVVKNELKSADIIRRERKTMERKRARNGRPSKKKGRSR